MSARSSRPNRARLQLLAPPKRPTRVPYLPPQRLPRRPGERREPLDIAVPSAIVAAAVECGLNVGCAIELCLERALVLADLAALGRVDVYERLVADAAQARVALPLPAAKARYLQMLVAARDRTAAADHSHDDAAPDEDRQRGPVVDVPLRLFPRVAAVADAVSAHGGAELAAALALEIAAVSDGRTMSEWAALGALRLSP